MTAVLGVLTGLSVLYGLYYGLMAVLGLFRGRPAREEAPPRYKIAAVIAARNEENVIGQAVKSLLAQRYPRELSGVYVAVNNSTDRTAEFARAAGANVIDCRERVRCKGDALRCAFRELLDTDFDAFVILDADNIADPDFFAQANLALCRGSHVAQGYRDSKNPGDGWVAGGTSIFYWFMSSLYNRSRANMGLSANLNGTGFMVSADLLRRSGFQTATLTEDLEFSAQCALMGEKIGWMEYARVYDDQPLRLWDSMVQRKRWYAGSLQCLMRYFPRLAKKHTLQAVDMAILFFGNLLMPLGLIAFALSAILTIRAAGFWGAVLAGLGGGAASAAAMDLGGYLVCRLEKKRFPGKAKTVLLFFLYMFTWMFANLSVYVTGMPKWNMIPHKPLKEDT